MTVKHRSALPQGCYSGSDQVYTFEWKIIENNIIQNSKT